MKKTVIAMAVGAMCLILSACVVAEPPHPAGCQWIEGHYGPYGGWHRGHCA